MEEHEKDLDPVIGEMLDWFDRNAEFTPQETKYLDSLDPERQKIFRALYKRLANVRQLRMSKEQEERQIRLEKGSIKLNSTLWWTNLIMATATVVIAMGTILPWTCSEGTPTIQAPAQYAPRGLKQDLKPKVSPTTTDSAVRKDSLQGHEVQSKAF